LSLYQPYPNHNCLHCHDDARNYLEVLAHQPLLEVLSRNERSCLSCHKLGHALDDVAAGNLWKAENRR
jgi:hypothetical protein